MESVEMLEKLLKVVISGVLSLLLDGHVKNSFPEGFEVLKFVGL